MREDSWQDSGRSGHHLVNARCGWEPLSCVEEGFHTPTHKPLNILSRVQRNSHPRVPHSCCTVSADSDTSPASHGHEGSCHCKHRSLQSSSSNSSQPVASRSCRWVSGPGRPRSSNDRLGHQLSLKQFPQDMGQAHNRPRCPLHPISLTFPQPAGNGCWCA